MPAPDRNEDRRPDPDTLLALSGKPGRGRLKVFLGAAPGVGKTYAMLQRAGQLRTEGADIVIGVVETHGRQETQNLLQGQEILPRYTIDYRGRAVQEFDIDAALRRKPALIVVDELAHTNAPGSRHPKRWQDVEELLDAGMDVWTALNIQHLESLADIVSKITGVQVRETVPDRILQVADDVVLVDITPDELIQRLHQGKVYLPDTARRAAQNFFTTGNITALRELALRRTADRVDDQMIDYLRQKAIEGPWETVERLLVCIGSGPNAEDLVRKAARIATGLNAGWLAVHLERADRHEPPAATQPVNEAMALAERLGGETMRIVSRDFVQDILRVARRENVTQIVIGRTQTGALGRLFGRSLPDQLIRNAGDIGVNVIATRIEQPAPRKIASAPRSGRGLVLDFAASIASVGVAIAIGHLIASWQSLPNLSMIFLAAVLACAVLRGVRAAVLAAFVSFLAYNFFFIEPLYTFTIAEPHELFALLVYLGVATLTGSLAGRLRQQSLQAWRRSQSTQALFEFSRRLSAASTAEDVAIAAAAHVHKTLGARVILLLGVNDDLEIAASWPPDTTPDAAEMSAARWAWQRREAAGWKTNTLPNTKFQFRPLESPRLCVGAFGFAPQDAAHPLDNEDENNLAAILEQTAIALDRALLVKEGIRSAALAENEKIREALLASLSHDLRTPLASITGAATTLRDLGEAMPAPKRQELLASIERETARLSRFVANILEMSRIESGALRIRRDWVDVADVVHAAVERIVAIAGRRPKVSIAAHLPFVKGDAQLLEQVVFNVLENACKYGGDEAPSVHVRQEKDDVVLSVTDTGPGIKPENLDKIFDKFFRTGRPDSARRGTGLGLAISRGLVEGMGGTIAAQSPALRRRGTRIVIRLPAASPDSKEAQA